MGPAILFFFKAVSYSCAKYIFTFCTVMCHRLMFCVSFPSEILTTPLPFAELDHALQCLSREDPSLRVSVDPDTRQASLNVLCSFIYLFICLIILHNG